MTTHSSTRWLKAQRFESRWWASHGDDRFASYQELAADITHKLSGVLTPGPGVRVLEVGSGPLGAIHGLDAQFRCALDPLQRFYSSLQSSSRRRDGAVQRIAGMGESLPFADHCFDLILITNVIDHCDDPARVLAELKRVAKRDGVVYLTVNVYHQWGRLMRLCMERFQLDEGHPHTFTHGSMVRICEQSGFHILKRDCVGIFSAWVREMAWFSWRSSIRALLFITRHKLSLVMKLP